MQAIYKICTAAEWAQAEAAGTYSGSVADTADGFIHFSTGLQAQATADKHFAGKRDLMLVAVDTHKLGDALKWEPSRGGDLFPHLYANLLVSAVIEVKPLLLGADGRHIFPAAFAVMNKR